MENIMKLKILNLVLGIILVGTIGLGGFLLYQDKMLEADIRVVQAPEQDEAFIPVIADNLENLAEIDMGTNLALKKRASTDLFNQVYIAENVIDGDVRSYWEGAVDLYPNHLSVDLGNISEVKAIRIKLNPNNIWGQRTQNLSVSKSDDDKNYTEIVAAADYDFNPDTGNCVIINFEAPIKAKYLQLIFNANTGASAGQAAEFEVY